MNNIPFISIILSMVAAIVMLLLGKKASTAMRGSQLVLGVIAVLSFVLIPYFLQNGGTITYMLGHYPSPWGNELRFGLLESILACVFATVLLLAIMGGKKDIVEDIQSRKQSQYFALLMLLLLSLLALIYTNDIFTAYVFIEINTIASCGIVMVKESGETLRATIKYLFMSLMASGLFLIAIALLYSITGHLLIPALATSIKSLVASGQYRWPLYTACALMTISLGVKSAMFPFHTWLPDAHGTATTSSSSILSGVVVKGYIILLIKIYYRVFGIEVVKQIGVLNVVFWLGIAGMIFGSLFAIKEKNLKRMIAYSSVAQIGYIYAGIGVGSYAGLAAALFHMIVHAYTKPLLFSSAGGLIGVSKHSKMIADMKGAARRNPIAGIGFLIGTLSMVGVPLFGGFTSKLLLAQSASDNGYAFLVALALSSFLNAIYYLPVLFKIYSASEETDEEYLENDNYKASYSTAIIAFAIINVVLGLGGIYVMHLLNQGVQLL